MVVGEGHVWLGVGAGGVGEEEGELCGGLGVGGGRIYALLRERENMCVCRTAEIAVLYKKSLLSQAPPISSLCRCG